jgi:MoaA/NifB/PqqE/SkfB family radical SAM enzyme
MCSIWKEKNKKVVKFKDAQKALLRLHQHNFGFLQITGGEPLLNPDVFSIMSYAKRLHFSVFLVTNGTLIDKIVARKLSKVCDNVGISFHHYDPFISEKIFNHKNVLNKTLNAIECLRKEKIPIEALFTASRYNMNDIEKTVNFINSLDINVSFSIPTLIRNTSYVLGGDCVKFSSEELKTIILEIIRLKKRGYGIINNMTFLKETVDFLDGKNKYPCLGGYKIFYLDWNLNFYPCMFEGKSTLINEINFNFDKRRCNKCFLACFREPSLFLISKPLTLKLVLEDMQTYLKIVR